MTLPALLFGVLISTFYGALFHLIAGGNLGRLLAYIILAWFGFWGGHLLAVYQGWSFLKVGPLQLGFASLGSAIMLAIGFWLRLHPSRQES